MSTPYMDNATLSPEFVELSDLVFRIDRVSERPSRQSATGTRETEDARRSDGGVAAASDMISKKFGSYAGSGIISPVIDDETIQQAGPVMQEFEPVLCPNKVTS